MRTTIQIRQISAVLRRLLATLLICLIVPGSVANAGSWVWCFSGNGHVAIEACGGPGCHSGSFEVADLHSDARGDAERIVVPDPAHADCIDVELLPEASLKSTRYAADDHGQSTGLDFERIVMLGGVCAGTAPLDGKSAVAGCDPQRSDRIDPMVLLRRVTVLRI